MIAPHRPRVGRRMDLLRRFRSSSAPPFLAGQISLLPSLLRSVSPAIVSVRVRSTPGGLPASEEAS